MDNFKIYTNGKYDIKANVIFKLRQKGPVLLQKLDDGFNRLYDI